MKVYTKKGDDGKTFTGASERELKSSKSAELTGAIDELRVQLGMACSLFKENYKEEEIYRLLQALTSKCLDIGSIVYFVNSNNTQSTSKLLQESFSESTTTKMEKYIDSIEATLPELKEFIIFDSCNNTGMALHNARTHTRRMERFFVDWYQSKEPNENMYLVQRYINRLSDLLFVIARKYGGDGTPRSKINNVI
jgi:cob(I)alamin adenosyltransferase